MTRRLSIGFLGGGLVTQAIHLPVLAGMRDAWQVGKVMDVDAEVARIVAERCGAAPCAAAAEVLEDPSIDVVAICSPNACHAEQAIAACHAGKRGVLCEKPLATTLQEAQAIAAAAAVSGTKILVGTMHLYDPAFRAGLRAFQATRDVACYVKSAIYLPSNGHFIDLATEAVHPSTPPPAAAAMLNGEEQRQRIRQTILGLAIHHIPLLRRFYPAVGAVLEARRLPPFGYSLLLHNGDQIAELLAFMPGQWPPYWTFEAASERHSLTVRFPPSYVAAGSGHAQLDSATTTSAFHSPISGYEAQWRHMHDVLVNDAPQLESLDAAIDDLGFAIELAEQSAAMLEIAA